MQAGELYRIRFSEAQGSIRSTRVGLHHGLTGVPLFLLFLEGISKPLEHRCLSLEALEIFASQFDCESDKLAILELKTFFEEGASLLQLIISPLDKSSKKSVLQQMLGSSEGYNKKSGLALLRNVGEYCDIIAVPQARTLLSPEESLCFYEQLLEVVSQGNAVFALLEAPRSLSCLEVADWSKKLSCPDAALYFPPLVYEGKEVSSLPAIAALYQKVDAQKGIAELPTLEAFTSSILPAIRLSPAQQMELLSARVNSVVMAPGKQGQVRVWGGHTLARPPDMEFSLIPVRRAMRALRESLESLAESYVLEPLSSNISLDVEHRVRNFLDDNRNIFDLYTKTPFDVSVSKLSGKDADGIEINCKFRLSRCVQELKLNFGVSQE